MNLSLLHRGFLSLVLLLSAIGLQAQISISGVVSDQASGEPIPGVTIRVDHSLKGATTNARGEFYLKDLPQGKQTLRFSAIGYQTQHATYTSSTTNAHIRLAEENKQLAQVVVTATGTHRRMAESPIPVQVITAKDLAIANVATLEEALSKLTSSFSFATNAMGTELSLNGLKSDYVLFLLNGNRMISDDAIQRINMNNVKRIEILNSSASLLYGSDAVGGVVNIITDDDKNGIEVASTTRVSNHQRINQSATLDLHLGKVSSNTSYLYQQAGNWQLSPMAEVTNKKTKKTTEEPTNKQASLGFGNHLIQQRFSYTPLSNLTLTAEGSFYDNMSRRPSEGYDYNIDHRAYAYGAGLQYIVSPRVFVDANFSADNYSSAYYYFKDNKAIKAGERAERKRVQFYKGDLRGVFKLSSNNKLSAGVEYLHDALSSTTDSYGQKKTYTASAFAQDEWTIAPGLELVAGLRYSFNETFHSHLSPSISLMGISGGLRGRISYTTGFKAPSLQQIYATEVGKSNNKLTLGNLNLKPEESHSLSVNLEYLHRRFSFSATAFFNYISNMINYRVLSPEEAAPYLKEYDEVQMRDNIDKARVLGLNLTSNAYLGAGFDFGGSLTLLNGKNITPIATKKNPHPSPILLDKSVGILGNAYLNWGHTWGMYDLKMGVMARGQGERYSVTYDYYSPSFYLIDLTSSHSFTLGDYNVSLGAGIENLLNWRDARPWNSSKPYASVNPGRTPYVSLTLRYRH